MFYCSSCFYIKRVCDGYSYGRFGIYIGGCVFNYKRQHIECLLLEDAVIVPEALYAAGDRALSCSFAGKRTIRIDIEEGRGVHSI